MTLKKCPKCKAVFLGVRSPHPSVCPECGTVVLPKNKDRLETVENIMEMNDKLVEKDKEVERKIEIAATATEQPAIIEKQETEVLNNEPKPESVKNIQAPEPATTSGREESRPTRRRKREKAGRITTPRESGQPTGTIPERNTATTERKQRFTLLG
jgi:predicted  nucleic acid-binding Zn-ribbon protein